MRENFTQIYVYRRKQLLNDWKTQGVKELLICNGYKGIAGTDIEENIEHLRVRLEESDNFPHEIGLFLGYPIEDVKGFIENQGLNYKCLGCWKVYGDECKARKIFAQYKACRQTYKMLFKNGNTLMQLTVAA